jgi:hypothetical protein
MFIDFLGLNTMIFTGFSTFRDMIRVTFFAEHIKLEGKKIPNRTCRMSVSQYINHICYIFIGTYGTVVGLLS